MACETLSPFLRTALPDADILDCKDTLTVGYFDIVRMSRDEMDPLIEGMTSADAVVACLADYVQ